MFLQKKSVRDSVSVQIEDSYEEREVSLWTILAQNWTHSVCTDIQTCVFEAAGNFILSQGS